MLVPNFSSSDNKLPNSSSQDSHKQNSTEHLLSAVQWGTSCVLAEWGGVPCVKLTCTKQVTRLPFLMPISDLPFLSLLPDREGRSSLSGPTAILPLCRLCSTPFCRGQTSQLGATFICWRYDKPWPSYLLSHRWKLET